MGAVIKPDGGGAMQNCTLNPAARRENARALAASIGLGVDAASELLNISIVVTHDEFDSSGRMLAPELVALLARTVSYVGTEIPTQLVTTEIVIGQALPRSQAPTLFISGNSSSVLISRTQANQGCYVTAHPILRLLSACYVAGATIKLATEDVLPIPTPDPLFVEFSQFGLDLSALDNPISLGKAYLAGAGAVGNGFLWALRYLKVDGELHVVDYDHVEAGNLNRQIWFDDEDINQHKAMRLSNKAQSFFPSLKLRPRVSRLQDLPEKSGSAWLPKLIVAVDSRLARRHLQNEFPGEVFDASTTDIREVVVHHHKQPTQYACLSCIYSANEQEVSREEHIAAHLGIASNKIQQQTVDEEAAQLISARFSDKFHNPMQLVGIAYDTLFKSLCGEGALKTPEGKQIVAPFAFVSVLAGTILALEVARRLQPGGHVKNFNYWRVSPWTRPFIRRQQLISAQNNCDFCSQDELRKVTKNLWG